jgi:hypothetical protein
MARVEVEEADLLSLQHIHGTVDMIMKNPETRRTFLQAAKKANPKLTIPEVDAAAPVLEEVRGIESKLEKFLEAQAERDRKAAEDASIRAFQNKWAEQEAQLRAVGWRANGIEAVKKFAEDNGIADLSIAADAFERRNPQPEPAQSSGAGWNLFGGGNADKEDTFVSDMMKSNGNDEGRLDREIRDALADIRSAR